MQHGGHALQCNSALHLINKMQLLDVGDGDLDKKRSAATREAEEQRSETLMDIEAAQTRRVLRGRRAQQAVPVTPFSATMTPEESQKWINLLVDLTMRNAVMNRAALYVKRDKFPVLFQAISANEGLLENLATQVGQLSNTPTGTEMYRSMQKNIAELKEAIERNMANAEEELEKYDTARAKQKQPKDQGKRAKTERTVRVGPAAQGAASKKLEDVVRDQLRDKGIPDSIVEWFTSPADEQWTDKQVLELRLVSGQPPAFDLRLGETIKSFNVLQRADATDSGLLDQSARDLIRTPPEEAARDQDGILNALQILSKSGYAMSIAAGSAWAWAAQVLINAATGTAAQVALLNNAYRVLSGSDWSDLDWSVVIELLLQGTINTISDLRDAIVDNMDLGKVPRVPGVFFGLARRRKGDSEVASDSYLAAILEALRSGLNTLWRVLGTVAHMLASAVRFIGRGLVSIGTFMIDHPAISLAVIGVALGIYFIGPMTLMGAMASGFTSLTSVATNFLGSLVTPLWSASVTLFKYCTFFFCTVGLGSSVFKLVVRRGLEKYTNIRSERTLGFISEAVSYLMLHVVCTWIASGPSDAVQGTPQTLPRRELPASREPYALMPVRQPGQPTVMPRNPGSILQPGVEPIEGSGAGGALVAVLAQSPGRSTSLVQTFDGSVGLVNTATLSNSPLQEAGLSTSAATALAIWKPAVNTPADLAVDARYFEQSINAQALPDIGNTLALAPSHFYPVAPQSIRNFVPVIAPTVEMASTETQIIRNVVESATLTVNIDENPILQQSLTLFESTGMMRAIALLGITLSASLKLT
jgi:hypothetical protein